MIRKANDLQPVTVPVPEWGTEGSTINVYPLTAHELNLMSAWWKENPSGVGYNVKLLSFSLKDLEISEVDMEMLATKSAAVISRLVDKAEALNSPNYERHEKNSEAGATENSG